MGYTGAYALQAAGQGLQNAGSQIGQALMGVASGQRARQQDMVEEQRYNDAMSMRLAQMKADGQQKKWMREQAEAQQARLDKIRQEEIDMRQAERRLGAVERATRLRTEGHPNAAVLYDTGTPGMNSAGEAVMKAASGLPYVEPGAYDPTATPGYKDLEATGNYYMGAGYGPRGQLPASSGSGGIGDDIKNRLIASANAQMGGDYTKLPEVLQTLTQRGAPKEYLDFVRSYFSGTAPRGGGGDPLADLLSGR